MAWERNLIFSFWLGSDFRQDPLVMAHRRTMRKYAEAHRAKFEFFNEERWRPGEGRRPHFQAFWMFDEANDVYDNIVCLDADVVAKRGLKESVFKAEGNGMNFSYRNSYMFWKKKAVERNCGQWMDPNPDVPGWNGGIYKFNREERQFLRPFVNQAADEIHTHCFDDEGLMHWSISLANKATGYVPKTLEDKWNWRPDLHRNDGRDPRNGNFYHCMDDKLNTYHKLKQMGLTQ